MKIAHYFRRGRSLSIRFKSKIGYQQNYSSFGHILIDRTCGLISFDMQTLQTINGYRLTKDKLNFNEAITLLCSFGMVDLDRSLQPHFGSGGYSVHSCVHSWTVFVLNKEWDESLARLALTCVASEVPSTNEKHWWVLQRRLFHHATRQALFIADGKIDVHGLHWAFHNLGDLYAHQGKLAEAEKMYIRADQKNDESRRRE